jgi:hypothetical protein
MWPNHFLWATPLNTVPLWLGFQHEFWRGPNIPTIAGKQDHSGLEQHFQLSGVQHYLGSP